MGVIHASDAKVAMKNYAASLIDKLQVIQNEKYILRSNIGFT